MSQYIAFLRSINVGGHVVKMDQLRRCFEALRFTNVETFIASGNVIFEARGKDPANLQGRIERHLHQSLGYEVATFLRTLAELERIGKARPFSESELLKQGNTLYVGLMADQPGKLAAQRVESLVTEVDDLKVSGREIYWLIRSSFSESRISGLILEKTLGVKITFRNMNTIHRLLKKYS